MSGRPRDNKGRPLPDGVRQRSDGSYEYRYTGFDGKRRSVYSWRLNMSDPIPAGKRSNKTIKELIREINKDEDDLILRSGGDLTVIELCERYIATKTGVTHNTLAGYKTVLRVLSNKPFGKAKIKNVRMTDAKIFLISLQKEDNKGFSSVSSIRGVLRPAFESAVCDDYIRKNPFSFQIHEVLVDDSHKREAITREQERKFMRFIKDDSVFSEYYDAMFILFNTGMRISEFCGLTINDLEFTRDKSMITIDHQLQRARDGSLYVIDKSSLKEGTKTKSGVRTIPVSDEVREAFERLLDKRGNPKIEPMVDGYTGFVILNRRARKGLRPMVAMDWEHIFGRAVNKYNDIYRVQMPKITPHVCRHTYCSNMAKSGMNPKVLQFLMGHSDISVTLNTYTHLKSEDACEEIKRLSGKKSSKII